MGAYSDEHETDQANAQTAQDEQYDGVAETKELDEQLRITALGLTVQSAENSNNMATTEHYTNRAQAFYDFLTGN
jgi:hypothetical protein